MTEYLIIRLDPSNPARGEWVLVNDLGAQLVPPASGELTAAANMAFNRKVLVLVPAMNVLHTFAELPVRGAAKQLQALPFAMEDQLAEDIEALHFAVGKRDGAGRLSVAVTDAKKMATWTTHLADAGLDVAGIYSDGEALGDIPGTTVLLLEPDQALFSDPEGAVTAMDHDNLQTLLELWLAGCSTEENSAGETIGKPIHMLVYSTPTEGDFNADLMRWIRDRVDNLDERVLADGPLPRMAAQTVTNPGINLLQGIYARRSNVAVHWPEWRLTAMLLLGIVAVYLGFKGADLYRLSQQRSALDTNIEQALRFTFPEVKEVRDPRALLDSKLRSRNSTQPAGNSAGFLDALEIISESIAAVDSVALEAISYRSGVTDLRIRTSGVEALDKIQKNVGKSGELKAEIQSANADGDQVLGRLQIKVRK